MAVLFFVLFLVCLVLLVTGLIKPSFVSKKKIQTRRQVVSTFGIGSLILLIVWIVALPKDQTTSGAVNTGSTSNSPVQTSSTSGRQTAIEAKQAVQTFDTVDNEYQLDYKQFSNIVSQLSSGTMDPVTAYSDLKRLEEQTLNTFSDAETISVPHRYSADKESMVLAVTYLRSSMGELKNFINDNQVKEMANATDDLKSSQQAEQVAVLQVASQAIKDGYQPPQK